MKKKCRTILPLIVLSLTSCLHVCPVVAGKYTFNLNKEYIASDGFCYERNFDSANQRYTLNFHKDDPRESSVESVGGFQLSTINECQSITREMKRLFLIIQKALNLKA